MSAVISWFTLKLFEAPSPLGWVFFGVCIAMVLAGALCSRSARAERKRKYIARRNVHVSYFFMTMGIAGLLLLFMSFEHVRFFGAKFWYPLWGAVVFLWLGWLWRFVAKKIPDQIAADKKRAEQDRYMPGRKTK